MLRSRLPGAAATIALLLSFPWSSAAYGQSAYGSSTRQTQAARGGTATQRTTQSQGSTSRGSAQMTFEQKFWRYLTSGATRYDEWGPLPGQLGMYPGQSPHGAFLKLFANRVARQNLADLPPGSILIKENYGPDQRTLMAVTVMYRSMGYHPEHGDWYWVKYNPDGTVAKTPAEQGSRPIRGRFQSCIDCHSGAGGGDYTFAND